MIVDSSALVAILAREPGWEDLSAAVAGATATRVGAPTLVETGMVLHRRIGAIARTALERFLADAEIETLPFTDRHWPLALRAFSRYGKGRHPAGLNFGDCLTYAVAFVAREPLLCLGDDFAQTDLELA